MVDDRSFEDVTERDPVEEPQHGLESDFDEGSLVRLLQNLDAEREDFGKFLALFSRRQIEATERQQDVSEQIRFDAYARFAP